MRRTTALKDRLMRRITISESGCWQWTGAIDASGYGRIGIGRRGEGVNYTHRVAYELFVGPIPKGRDLDHLCRNRPCCNPEHLEAVERLVNVARGLRGKGYRLTHCKQGHEFTPENTRVSARQRRCITCARESGRRATAAYAARKKAISA